MISFLRFISFEYLVSYAGGAWLAGGIAEAYVRPLERQTELLLITISAVIGALICAFTIGKAARNFRIHIERRENRVLGVFYALSFLCPFALVLFVFFFAKEENTALIVVFFPIILLAVLILLYFRNYYSFSRGTLRILCVVAVMGGTFMLGLISSFIFYLQVGIIDLD